MISNYKKILLITFILLIIIFFIRFLFFNKATISIEATATNATVFVDNKEIGKTPLIDKKLSLGKHTIKIQHPYYQEYLETIVLKRRDVLNIKAVLKPAKLTEKEFNNLTLKEQEEYESSSSQTISKESKQLSAAYPLINGLPYISPDNDFRIDYGGDPESGITFIITSYGADIKIKKNNEEKALNWIRNKGFNPADLKIEVR